MILTETILEDLPAQVLCLDKRVDHHYETVGSFIGSFDVYEFKVGDGQIWNVEDYNMIDFDNEFFRKYINWGYGLPDHKINHFNAFMAHHQMVRRAKMNNWKAFLMLEDDAYMTERFHPIWDSLLDSVAGHMKIDCDILYLGWWMGDENDEFNTQIEDKYKEESKTFEGAFQIHPCEANIGGLHGAIITEDIYDTILGLPPNDPIDCQLNRMNLRRSYITPKIIHTKTMMSNCEGQIIERKDL